MKTSKYKAPNLSIVVFLSDDGKFSGRVDEHPLGQEGQATIQKIVLQFKDEYKTPKFDTAEEVLADIAKHYNISVDSIEFDE